MSFKEKVHKVLLELAEDEKYTDIKKDILSSVKEDVDAVRIASEQKMEEFFDNMTKNIKKVVIEVIEENPDILKKKEDDENEQ